jgi:YD repeat-containing protein
MLSKITFKFNNGVNMNRLNFALFLILSGLTQLVNADEVRQYHYDAMHRLIGVSYVGQGMIQYTYDKLGNRLSESQTLGTAAVAPATQTVDSSTALKEPEQNLSKETEPQKDNGNESETLPQKDIASIELPNS